jgi:uncharacterized protein (TIGR03067 family)
MTRFVLLGGLLLALSLSDAAADDKKKDVPKDLVPFQGTWKVTEVTFGGTVLPKDQLPEQTFTFAGNKVSVDKGKGGAEPGTFSVDTKKEPFALDSTSDKGEKLAAIYKFDKDGKLTLCIGVGKGAARPKAFDEKQTVLLVMEKVKK